jgi:hypothetical protein
LIHGFNERFLELLTQVAQVDDEQCLLDIVRLHRDLWLRLDVDARKRASQFPYLLIDIHFHSEEWWLWARTPSSRQGRDTSSSGIFAPKLAVELMYEALLLAWHTARSDGPSANILLAMSPGVVLTVAALEPRDITHIAEHHNHHLRPRWEHLPTFWRHVLAAACSGDNGAIHDLHHHGLHLLGTDSSSLASDRQNPQPSATG